MQLAATVPSCQVLQGEGDSRESRGNSDKLSTPLTPGTRDGGSSLAACVILALCSEKVTRIGVCVYVSIFIACCLTLAYLIATAGFTAAHLYLLKRSGG